jgi:hypothetical protein
MNCSPVFVICLDAALCGFKYGGDEAALDMQAQLSDRRGGVLACPAFVITTCSNDVIMALYYFKVKTKATVVSSWILNGHFLQILQY